MPFALIIGRALPSRSKIELLMLRLTRRQSALNASDINAQSRPALSPDLARAVAASPGLAALSLVSRPLSELAAKHPDLAELAVVSPNLALVASRSPEMAALAKASPPLAAAVESMLSRLSGNTPPTK